VESAWRAGIVVVAAAGNEGRNNSANTNGYETIAAPGNDPYGITLGAMKTMETPSRTDDLIASHSSKGPTLYDHVVKPDLVAPGNRIASPYKAYVALNVSYPGNRFPILCTRRTATVIHPPRTTASAEPVWRRRW
jgi:serine protease AprX